MKHRNDEARCNATIFAVEPTYCMTVHRKVMLTIMSKELNAAITRTQSKYEQFHLNKVNDDTVSLLQKAHVHKQQYTLHAHARRITAFDMHNNVHSTRSANLLRRFGRYVVESLVINQYYRLYKELLLSPEKVDLYGEHVIALFTPPVTVTATTSTVECTISRDGVVESSGTITPMAGNKPPMMLSRNSSMRMSHTPAVLSRANSIRNNNPIPNMHSDTESISPRRHIPSHSMGDIPEEITHSEAYNTLTNSFGYDRKNILNKLKTLVMYTLLCKEPDDRSAADIKLIFAVLSQKCYLRDTICHMNDHSTNTSSSSSNSHDVSQQHHHHHQQAYHAKYVNHKKVHSWSNAQYMELCRLARGQQVAPMETVYIHL